MEVWSWNVGRSPHHTPLHTMTVGSAQLIATCGIFLNFLSIDFCYFWWIISLNLIKRESPNVSVPSSPPDYITSANDLLVLSIARQWPNFKSLLGSRTENGTFKGQTRSHILRKYDLHNFNQWLRPYWHEKITCHTWKYIHWNNF